MKRIPFFFQFLMISSTLATASLLLSACSKAHEFEYVDETTETGGGSDIVVTDENGDLTALPANTTVGVYVIGEDGSVTLQQVEADENGNVVLPASAQGGAVIAYSPYQEDWGEAAFTSMPVFRVEADQTTEDRYNASDLMIGATGTATRAASSSSMTFRHMLAKIAIHVVDETGRIDLSHIGTELINVNSSVTVDLAGQSVSPIEAESCNVAMHSEMTTDWRISSYAIVAPQQVAEGTTFYAVTLYGNRQNYPIPQAATLEGGKLYTINLRLTDYGLLPDGWYISDWNEEEEQNLDAFAVKN